jgi:hypothetical protein
MQSYSQFWFVSAGRLRAPLRPAARLATAAAAILVQLFEFQEGDPDELSGRSGTQALPSEYWATVRFTAATLSIKTWTRTISATTEAIAGLNAGFSKTLNLGEFAPLSFAIDCAPLCPSDFASH